MAPRWLPDTTTNWVTVHQSYHNFDFDKEQGTDFPCGGELEDLHSHASRNRQKKRNPMPGGCN
jgi:ribosomal protein S2